MPKIQTLFPKIFIPSLFILASTPAQAQITPDNTLGAERSIITPNALINGANADLINGGAQRGNNLFHSFIEFNINNGQRVYFGNPSGVQNILTRVTGANGSNILGTLGVNGNANLFLINPNGIVFGRNGSLDIRGSFVGTTANGVQFGNQGIFSATNPQAPPLLTINPSALLFNQINQGAIINRSSQIGTPGNFYLIGGDITFDGGAVFSFGNRLELGAVAGAGTVELIGSGNQMQLAFPEGVSKADIVLQNNAVAITIGGGAITLNARNISLSGGSSINAFNFGEGKGGNIRVVADDLISLNGLVSISSGTTGQGDAGNIQIQTRVLNLFNGGNINTSTTGSGNGGDLLVNASDSINLIGSKLLTSAFGSGNSGQLTINTEKLSVLDGGAISTTSSELGRSGNLTINAKDSVEVVGASPNNFSTISTSTLGSEDAGSLTINTGRLSIRDGAEVLTDTGGAGKAGNLTINANSSVEVIGTINSFPSVLSTSPKAGSTGNGGDLTINTQNLFVRDGAQVTTDTGGAGKAGNLTINANSSVEVIGTVNGVPSLLSAISKSTGNGGDLTINTQDLLVQGGADVTTETFGAGKAGNLTINADRSVQLIGTSADGNFSSYLSASSYNQGNAGNLTINTQDLLVRDGAQVGVSTSGQGKGGNLTINASNSIQLIGIGTSANGNFPSGLFASAEKDSTGNAGDLTINTQDLLVQDGAIVSAATNGTGKGGNLNVNATSSVQLTGMSVDGSFLSTLRTSANQGSIGNAGNLTIHTPELIVRDGASVSVQSIGTGNAGILTINADTINLDNKASLNANTRSPNKDPNKEQATINLNSPFILLRRNSNITTNATGENVIGGNININTDILAAVENSDISANSSDSRGGRVKITAQGIFGTQPRNFLTPESDITATGANPDLSGTTEINTPNVDPTHGLIELPNEVIDASTKFSQICPRDRHAKPLGNFIITGRGSLPPSPLGFLTGTSINIPLATLEEQTATPIHGATIPVSNPSPEIIEAQGWIKTADGIVLVANAPEVTPSSRPTAPVCPVSKDN